MLLFPIRLLQNPPKFDPMRIIELIQQQPKQFRLDGQERLSFQADLTDPQAVAAVIVQRRLKALVVDPVMVATSGAMLLKEKAVDVLRRQHGLGSRVRVHFAVHPRERAEDGESAPAWSCTTALARQQAQAPPRAANPST